MLPTGALRVISQHEQRVRVGTLGNAVFFEEWNEVVDNDRISVLLVERPDVRDEGRSKQHVADDDLEQFTQVDD